MLTVHSQGRPGHRRSYCQATGAFTSLGALPRRGSTSSIPQRYPAKKPTFHFRQDDQDDDDDDDDDDEPVTPLRLKISTNNVPFPGSSPSPLHSPSVTRPTLGKPFKSSLKSSTSSPNIPFPSQSLVPSIMFPDLHPKQQQQQQQHQRASSAPCTPLFASSSESSLSSPTHHPSKNVHFPSQDLATIRVFNRSARPDSLGRLGEETETETEGEGSGAGRYIGGSTFPFPQVFEKSPLCQSKQKYQINWSQSSGIPRTNVDRAIENIFFESLHVGEGANDGTAFFFFYIFSLLIFLFRNRTRRNHPSSQHHVSKNSLGSIYIGRLGNCKRCFGMVSSRCTEWMGSFQILRYPGRFAPRIGKQNHVARW